VTAPLAGIRVLDVSAMITGPLATMQLADLGAEVVKVEPPGTGDILRLVGTNRGGMSAFFATLNRGKRSMVVDLREERGREIVRRLARDADVFVQNFRPGVIERLGLDEGRLRAEREDLIYVSISAFGATGPLASRPAYDHVIQGMTGSAYIQAALPGAGPEYVRNAWCDKITSYTATQSIIAALFARERGAGGQHLQISMLDAAISFLWPDGMSNHTILEDDVTVLPPISASYRHVVTRDGFISIAAITDAQWHGIFRAVDRPELVEDPRFATAVARSENLLALLEELGGGKIDMSSAEALERLRAEDVPCGPILAPEEVHRDPQVIASGTLVESVHPQLGRMREPRPPALFGATPAAIRGPAPALGADTDAILGELGLAAGEAADLRAKGIVA
jgi:crotonobetainyl-CoA:carnitine CoA-transferase CaiB-like acyl-CoA transferase